MKPRRQVGRVRLRPETLRSFCIDILEVYGAPRSHAILVTEHLVLSNLVGVPSHGVLRLSEYVTAIQQGDVDPAATPVVEFRRGSVIGVDGRKGFGQVAAHQAVESAAEEVAASGICFVSVRRTGHTGRIGMYTEMLAERGLAALAFSSVPRPGHMVAPYGGLDARLGTNPLSYAFPTLDEPIVADFSTSAMPEGVIRHHLRTGLPLPEGVLRNRAGRFTTNPASLYGTAAAVIQPFGGPDFGYRGTALAVLVELLATILSGDDSTDVRRRGSDLAIIAIAPDPNARDRATQLARYVRSSRPLKPNRPVMLPGDPERNRLRSANPVEIDGTTWRAFRALARVTGASLPELASSD